MEPVLARLETFYDAVPRRSAAVEEHGPLRLFLPEPHAWPYYARPAAPGVVVTPDDVLAVRARQRELGLPEALEWVDDLVPTMSDAAAHTGLTVQRCPILVLDGDPAAPPPGVRTRVLGTDDEELALAEAVAALGFAAGIGTRTGAVGAAERDRAVSEVPVARLTRLCELIRDGAAARVVATLHPGADPGANAAAARVVATQDSGADADPDTAGFRVVATQDPAADSPTDTVAAPSSDPALCGPLAAGGYQRAGDVAEIVGVATLPAARRRGLGGAVAGALARAALEAGVTTVFLSAQDDTVARVYERVGFRRVGTAGIAEPAP